MAAFKKKNWGLRTDQLGDNLFFYAVDLDSKDLLADFWGENTLPEHPLIVSTGGVFTSISRGPNQSKQCTL